MKKDTNSVADSSSVKSDRSANPVPHFERRKAIDENEFKDVIVEVKYLS